MSHQFKRIVPSANSPPAGKCSTIDWYIGETKLRLVFRASFGAFLLGPPEVPADHCLALPPNTHIIGWHVTAMYL